MKINNTLPYDVEEILIQKLDVNRRCVKNWWDIGRKLEISDSELRNVKQEENREGESPTRCLLVILSTKENIISLRKFIEITHELKWHDISMQSTNFTKVKTLQLLTIYSVIDSE